jgi:Antitoxin of toxin-antitoxin, RelE / RelB, TA system
MHELSLQPLGMTQFRDTLKDVYASAVDDGIPVLVAPAHANGVGMLVDAELLLATTAGLHFHPEVMREDESISIWLPELELYGIGATAAEAESDLLDELIQYLSEYFAMDYRSAPKRQGHLLSMVRVLAANALGRLHEVVFETEPAGL